MTRTSIRTANGDTYRRDGMIFRNLRRILRTVIFLFLALITSAAVIGFFRAATDHSTNSPSAHSLSILHKAEKAGGKNCRLEWNAKQNDHEVICDPAIPTADYNDGFIDGINEVRTLNSRPAKSTATISDPNGKALLAECLSDSTLSRDEFAGCITQP